MPTKVKLNATGYSIQTNVAVPISQVICDPSINPQRMFGTDQAVVDSIAESIERIGQKQPCLAYRDHEGRPVVYDGRHRYAGTLKLEEQRIANGGKPGDENEYKLLLNITNINPEDALLVGIETASQRNEYGPADHCALINLLKEAPYNFTEQEIAKRLNVSQSYVNQCSKLAVLDKNTLRRVNKKRGEKGHIPFKTAYQLTQVAPEERKQLLEDAGEEGSVDSGKVREKVRQTNQTVTVARSAKEIKELLTGLTGPGEHPVAAALAGAVLDFWNGKLQTDKGVHSRVDKAAKETGWEQSDEEASEAEVAAEAAPAGQA